MKTNLKEINSYTRQLDVTIAWDLIEKDYQNEFKRARSRYSMPGFRKGKGEASGCVQLNMPSKGFSEMLSE